MACALKPNTPGINIMNIKTFFGIKSTAQVSPSEAAMAERVSTAAGCQALVEELTQQQQAAPGASVRASSLRRKLEELARLQKGHAIEADRQRVAAVVKRDQDSAAKALKAAEARLKSAQAAAGKAGQSHGERAALIARLNLALVELQATADQALKAAAAALHEVVLAGGEQSTAFDAHEKARLYRATCGDQLAATIKIHQDELSRMEQSSSAAAAELQGAQDDVDQCRLAVARVEYDQAAQGLVDAFIKMRALRHTDSTGRLFPGTTIQDPNVTFASKERAVWGDQVCGTSSGLHGYALAAMARTLAPADIATLVEPMERETPEPEAALPDPFSFIPGSDQFHNAMAAHERRRVGAAQHEANLRAVHNSTAQAA